MRLLVVSALSIFATPAFACGMYIPEDLRVASIGELMEEVDRPTVGVAIPSDDEAQLAAIVTPAAIEVIPEVVEVGEVADEGVEAEQPAQQADIAEEQELTRKERRALERRAKNAGV